MSYAVRHELAEWVRTITSTLVTTLVVLTAVQTGSWAVVFFGAVVIGVLFFAASRIDRKEPADSK